MWSTKHRTNTRSDRATHLVGWNPSGFLALGSEVGGRRHGRCHGRCHTLQGKVVTATFTSVWLWLPPYMSGSSRTIASSELVVLSVVNTVSNEGARAPSQPQTHPDPAKRSSSGLHIWSLCWRQKQIQSRTGTLVRSNTQTTHADTCDPDTKSFLSGGWRQGYL